jgi:hypothetical protein
MRPRPHRKLVDNIDQPSIGHAGRIADFVGGMDIGEMAKPNELEDALRTIQWQLVWSTGEQKMAEFTRCRADD